MVDGSWWQGRECIGWGGIVVHIGGYVTYVAR